MILEDPKIYAEVWTGRPSKRPSVEAQYPWMRIETSLDWAHPLSRQNDRVTADGLNVASTTCNRTGTPTHVSHPHQGNA